MSDALDRVLSKIRELPAEDQALAAELLEDFAANAQGDDGLAASDEELLAVGLADAEAGRFASEDAVKAVFAKYRK